MFYAMQETIFVILLFCIRVSKLRIKFMIWTAFMKYSSILLINFPSTTSTFS